MARQGASKPEVADARTCEQEVFKCLAFCSEASTIADARGAIDDLFDQFPDDTNALCVLARELCVNLLGGNRNLLPSDEEVSGGRRRQLPVPGAKSESLRLREDEDEDEDEDDDADDEDAYLERKRDEFRRAAQNSSKSPSRLSAKAPPRQQHSAPPLPPTPHADLQSELRVLSSALYRAGAAKNIAVPQVRSESQSESGSDIPSQSSDGGDSQTEIDDSEDESQDWRKMYDGTLPPPPPPARMQQRDEGKGPPPLSSSSSSSSRRAPESSSPSKLLSYNGDRQPPAFPRPEWVDGQDGQGQQKQSPLTQSARRHEAASDINDSIDSCSTDGFYRQDEPWGAQAAPRDAQGSLQYLRENILFDNEMLDALMRNAAKYSMRAETERVFTRILGDGYMSAPAKHRDRSGVFRSSGGRELHKETLSSPSGVAAGRGGVRRAGSTANTPPRPLPRWGKGQRFASPTAPAHKARDALNTSGMGSAASRAPRPPVRPIRYYVSLSHAPTYNKASNAKTQPAPPTRRLPPAYKYPKPTPPKPPAAKVEALSVLAEKAGIGPAFSSTHSAGKDRRQRTYMYMSRIPKPPSANKRRSKKKPKADETVDASISEMRNEPERGAF